MEILVIWLFGSMYGAVLYYKVIF